MTAPPVKESWIDEDSALEVDGNSDWGQKKSIRDGFLSERDKICDLLGHFDAICNGRFRAINATEYRVESIPNVTSVHQPPYRAAAVTRAGIRR